MTTQLVRPAHRDQVVVSADGSKIQVEVYGADDRPAVVLSHGWTCSIRFWAAQITDLAVDHRVIVYDQRGHGRTPPPADGGFGYSTDALADDLEAVLSATLKDGEKAVVAGHSMGGMTIMAAARRPAFRKHVAAALLCSTGCSLLVTESLIVPLRSGRMRTWLTRKLLGSPAPLGPVTALSKRILRYGTMGPGATAEQIAECARIVHACPRPARVAWSRVLDELDLEADVRELTVPTAIIVGSADRLTPPVHARTIEAGLPRSAGLTEVPGTGHMSPVEEPELVTARIRELVGAHLTTKEDAV